MPTRYGGPGGSVRDVLTAVITIAGGSSNVAQALRAHFGYSERLLSNRATEAERAEWFPRIDAGLVFGNAVTDARGDPGRSRHDAARRPRRCAATQRYKFYSTGTLYADVVAVSAVDHAGRDLQAVVPVDRDGVELFDDWDGFGQRVTASGGTRFTNVAVDAVEVTTVTDGAHLGHSTTFQQLYLAAVTAGIGLGVLDDAVSYVQTRPALHHTHCRHCGEGPVHRRGGGRHRIGGVAAKTLVLSAADEIDRLVDRGLQDDVGALAGSR